MPYLVERVQQLRNQRTTWAGSTKDTLKTELVKVSDETVCRGAEGERVSPKVPLESNDGRGEHASPNKGESGLSSSKTGVEECETRNHDQHHGRGHENVGLVTRGVPLVKVLGD